MKKIQDIAAQQQALHPETAVDCLPEMGIHQQLMAVMRRREIETQQGTVAMNCEMCKFRLAAASDEAVADHGHHHHHGHGHSHDHHDHEHPMEDPYAEPAQYHERIWQVP